MIEHNPSTSVHISAEADDDSKVHIRFIDASYEIVGEFTWDRIDQLIGCGNAFALAYKYLQSLEAVGYTDTVMNFNLMLEPENVDLTDVDLTVEDILNDGNT